MFYAEIFFGFLPMLTNDETEIARGLISHSNFIVFEWRFGKSQNPPQPCSKLGSILPLTFRIVSSYFVRFYPVLF
jgi:hypothetical protein